MLLARYLVLLRRYLRPAKGLKAGSVKFFEIVDGLPAFFLCLKRW